MGLRQRERLDSRGSNEMTLQLPARPTSAGAESEARGVNFFRLTRAPRVLQVKWLLHWQVAAGGDL